MKLISGIPLRFQRCVGHSSGIRNLLIGRDTANAGEGGQGWPAEVRGFSSKTVEYIKAE